MSVRSVVTMRELQEIIAAPRLTVVDFFAKWCGPCKQIAPLVHNLSSAHPNVSFVKVDVDEAKDIAMEYRIRAMPTFKLFKSGNMVKEFEGANFPLLESLVKEFDVAPPPPPSIPSAEQLEKMKPKELLQLMQSRHISSEGLLEKSELIAQINRFR
jgi:thioredoxin 1